MANPFQDKFLKAGLVNKKQVKKSKHQQRISKKQAANNPAAKAADRVAMAQAAEKKRSQELNRQRDAEKLRRERLAQIKQLIEQNLLEKDERGEAYNFVDGKKIKRIYVADEIADKISCGQAGIVKSGSSYEVVPAKVARQIGERDKGALLVLHDD